MNFLKILFPQKGSDCAQGDKVQVGDSIVVKL